MSSRIITGLICGSLSSTCLFLAWFKLGSSSSLFLLFSFLAPLLSCVILALNLNKKNISSEVKKEKRESSKLVEKSIFKKSADVICLVDTNAIFKQVSPASEKILGFKPEEIIGHSLVEYIDQENSQEILNNILNSKDSIARTSFETKFKKKSGQIIDLLWSVHWSVTESALFCVAHDISERKEKEQILKASEERVRSILENLPAAVLVVRANDGQIVFMNRLSCSLTGRIYTNNESTSTTNFDNIISANNLGTEKLELSNLLKESVKIDLEAWALNTETNLFPIDLSLSHLELSGESCYLAIFIDVSYKHAIEKLKQEFLSMVSHDLRTPLTSISSVLDFLNYGKGGDLNDEAKLLTNKAGSECNRLMRLVHDLLDLEKMRSGKFILNCHVLNFYEIANRAIDSIEPQANNKDISIALDCPESINLKADGDRLIQVLINLLDNAIKFSPRNGLINISVIEKEQKISAHIQNRGNLIPPEKIDSIFDRFEQAHVADTDTHKGSGLGLAICKTLINLHHGKIEVKSNENEGTIFSFDLPK